MAAPMQSCEDSLETVTAMLNQTFIETGLFFRNLGSLQARTQFKRSVPVICDKYQSTLDDLQEQIFIAKGILEKDYEKLIANTSQKEAEDISMGDSGAPIAPIKESASPTEEKVPPSQGQATVAPSTSTTPQSSSSAPFTDTIPAECTVPTSSAPVSAPLSLPTKPKTPIKSPEVSEDVLGGDNMMDIMASMTAAESHSLSAENTAMDMGFGSLLPGLESYANAGNDDGIIEIPSADDDFLTNNTNDHNNDLNSGAQAENGKSTAGDMTVHPPHHNSAQMHHDAGRTDAPMDDVGPTESTFDDLFVGVADFSGNGDELLLQGADLKELDDVWLNRF